MSTDLTIMPFGGMRENGKNMYAVTVGEDIFILDAGLQYPENDLLGVDVVIPDFKYLVERADQIAGIFLTHGHADAIGALPYLLSEINVPIFGSELTIELAKLAIENNPQTKTFTDYHVVTGSQEIDFGDVKVSFFETTHTIPESLGIVIETPAGQVVYTGDFKFDTTAAATYQMDLLRLAEIGRKGVKALLIDAAGTGTLGQLSHESEIEQYIYENFRHHSGRIVVAAVASNIQRIQQVVQAAYRTHRKIVLSGNDIEKSVRTALRLGKLELPAPEKELFVSLKNLKTVAPEATVILETGKMGEPLRHLQRMAHGDDRNIKITDGDLVFITTTPSTAMEGFVAQTRDMLFRAGADVKQISSDMNSSGHASKNDFQMMLNLLKPENVLPVQGEYRMLNAGYQATLELGISKDHAFILKNGDRLVFDNQPAPHLAGSIQVDATMIDGSGIGDIGSIVLNDRRILSEDGVFIAVITIDRKKKKVIAHAKVDSRGFVYVKTSRDLLKEATELVETTVAEGIKNTKEFDWGKLKGSVRDALGKFLYEKTHRKPVILPVIMEANQNGRRRRTANKKAGDGKNKKVNQPANKAKKSAPNQVKNNAKVKASVKKDDAKPTKPRNNRRKPASKSVDSAKPESK